MNDNLIKMFIGGEEVVSNKEFTINEEMLSASSTILNNCYPASWEENKDYVSNFYYPKDYSKYILGKGNFTYGTDQYYILTISGSNFIQFTTNVEKEFAGFTVYGNTTQETRQGYNLVQISNTFRAGSSATGITPSITADNELQVITTSSNGNWHTGWWAANQSFNNIENTLNTGDTFTISFTIKKTANSIGKPTIYIKAGMGYYNMIGNVSTEYSEIYYTGIWNDNNGIAFHLGWGGCVGTFTIKNWQLKKGNYQPYEEFGEMPSPNYPSELISVGYQNYLYHNQLPSTKANVTVTYNSDDNTYSLNGTANANWNLYILTYTIPILSLKAGESVTYTIKRISGTSRIRFLNYFEDDNGNLIETDWGIDLLQNQEFATKTRTAIKTGKIAYVQFFIYNGTVYNDKVQIMVTKGNKVLSYIPYNKYGIEVKTRGKNLFDNSKILSVNDTIATPTETGFNAKGLWYVRYNIFNLSGTYTISYKFTRNSGPNVYNAGKIRFHYEDNTYSNFFESPHTFNTNKKINYILFYTDSGSDIVDIDFKDVMLQEGTNATSYEEYKGKTYLYTLNEPLRKTIGTSYKDKLYIKNGYLYVERKIKKIILNGTENWRLYTGKNNTFSLSMGLIVLDGLCNYYKKFASPSQIGVVNGIYLAYTNSIIITNLDISTVEDFKTWLSTHNTEVIYAIQNSTIEELGTIESPYSYQGDNIIEIDTGIDTTSEIDYYWKNYDVLFAGIVKNSGDISLKPTNPKYCSLQILDYKTFLSESDTLDFVISDKTIAEAISMVVDAIRGYGFILGTINISQADDIIGAYSTLNKTAYDVFQYLANISGSRWRARFVDSDTMAIDFYDPELLPRANDIDYTQQYWEDNKIVDLTFNYGTRDYRNKQIILSDEVYGGIDYTEVLLSNGYGTSYITQNNIANITSITVNGVEAEVITQSEKDLGVDADFYYTPGKNVVESTTSYTAGTQIIITYTPLVKGRQIVYNDEEVTRIATQTNTTGVISRYENRNDILSSDELENIAETYIKYKGKPEIILKLTTLNNDLFNIGEICYFNSPIADLAQDYMVKSKATNYTSVAGETNIFYTYELTSSFNSEKAINYFDNQRNKATGNIAEGESITRNIDINNSAMIIWENATITEISVSVDGDNALNSVLNSPFIQ